MGKVSRLPGRPIPTRSKRERENVCPTCARSYEDFDIRLSLDGSIIYACPFCEEPIANARPRGTFVDSEVEAVQTVLDSESSVRLDEARRNYQQWLEVLDAEKQKSVSELEEGRGKRLTELTSLHGEVMLTVADPSLLFRLLRMILDQTTATYEARVVRELKFVELSAGQIRGALDKYKELETKRANARRMAIIVPVAVLVLVVAVIVWGLFPGGPTVNDVIPIIQVPLPVLVWSIIGSIIAIPYRFNKSGEIELQDPLRWVFTRPLTGMVMGILAYYILRAGFITVAAETQNPFDPNSGNFGLMIVYWLVAFIGGFSDRFADGFLKTLVGRFGGDTSVDVVSLDHRPVPTAYFLKAFVEGLPDLSNNKQVPQVEKPNEKELDKLPKTTDVEPKTADAATNN